MDEIGDTRRTAIIADPTTVEKSGSAVSWSAIFAGGVGAAAFSLILLTLGTGLGLASISPWAPPGESASRFGFAAIVWICVTQILASGLGGYLAGRLRKRWVAVHVDETYFRDTAHGFLSWALSTLVTALLLTSAISGLIHTAAQVASAGASGGTLATLSDRGNASAAANTWPMGYLVDGLFRQPDASSATPGVAPPGTAADQEEVVRIFLNGLPSGNPLSANDAHYAARLVARRTGLSEAAAQSRVSTAYSQLQQKRADLKIAARDAADKARKAAIYASLWLFVSLLMGAFSASLSATFGGRQRDL
ncbi:hypothetical protein M3I54_37305 [Paraburkholderia sp. CNPSo 3274]|uniref:hypothetical protein n=1 Tax=Paraburkholderia sp. CNPSo 3274 TaxID=2940932 RepID=UPI0020B8B769|nr:hypothetical protein [Paraburkholderia sp. CNPSo 3274]MCP3712514.1 hypothetical protein [Paraburkholderia sp. CNPSo 3274]